MSKYFFLNQTQIFNISQPALILLPHELVCAFRLESCCFPRKWQVHYAYIYTYRLQSTSSDFELLESRSQTRIIMQHIAKYAKNWPRRIPWSSPDRSSQCEDNIGSKRQCNRIIMAQNPQMLHSTSQPNSVKIPCVFLLLLQSFYVAQDKITIKKLAASQPYHRSTNTNCSSTCRTREWEWNGLSGSAAMRDGIIWREKRQKYSDPSSRRINGIFCRFHTCSLAWAVLWGTLTLISWIKHNKCSFLADFPTF